MPKNVAYKKTGSTTIDNISTTSVTNPLPRQCLPSSAMWHRMAFVLYQMVPHGGTYEAPDSLGHGAALHLTGWEHLRNCCAHRACRWRSLPMLNSPVLIRNGCEFSLLKRVTFASVSYKTAAAVALTC